MSELSIETVERRLQEAVPLEIRSALIDVVDALPTGVSLAVRVEWEGRSVRVELDVQSRGIEGSFFLQRDGVLRPLTHPAVTVPWPRGLPA